MISIIAPLYNEGDNIAGLVEHLASLENLHEVLLVDASDQQDSIASFESARQLNPSPLRFIRGESRGRAAQMNAGAAAASGDILLFLHCDSRLPDEAITLVEKEIQSGYQWGRFDVALDAPGAIYRLIESMIRLRSRLRRLATGDQGIFITADLFRRCGGFPEVELMEDIALSRILKKNSKPALITTPLVTSARRWQKRGAISTILLMWKLRLLYWAGVEPSRLSQMYGDER